jgi:FAD/FMN-containing dehydrogenase
MATVTTLQGLDELRSQLGGELITREDAAYEEARKVYNGMADKHPAVIVRAADAADVSAAIGFARAHGLEIAVRGGGHNVNGFGTIDDGLVIDLSPQRWVRVDPATQRVQVGGGARLMDISHATAPYGLSVPYGVLGTTGIGGLSLGGGLGYLTRKYGLAIDNMLEADVVLADGSIVRASADENADLFWAIRGGGGNFGVVTAFTFQAHPVSTVIAGPMFWPLERTQEVMRFWSDYMDSAPDDVNSFFIWTAIPPVPLFPEALHNQNVVGIIWALTCSDEQAAEALAPARALEPMLDGVGPMPLAILNGLFDPLLPPGDRHYWRADFIDEFSDDAIAKYAELGPSYTLPKSQIHLYRVDGATSRVAPEATAWRHRDAKVASVIFSAAEDPSEDDAARGYVVSAWEAFHPYAATTDGAYVNFMMEEGADRVQASYGSNYERLAEIKAKYDPENVFHVNQNIRPAA